MRTLVMSLLFPVLLSSCVKQSTYDKALDDNKKLQGQLDAANKKEADTEKTLGDQIKELQGQLGTLDETAKNKEAELGKVKGEKAATEAELAELRRQKEAAEKRHRRVQGAAGQVPRARRHRQAPGRVPQRPDDAQAAVGDPVPVAARPICRRAASPRWPTS